MQIKNLTNPNIRPFEDRIKMIQGGALLKSEAESADIDLENIEENEDQEERTISN